jgi:hypothetical protein
MKETGADLLAAANPQRSESKLLAGSSRRHKNEHGGRLALPGQTRPYIVRDSQSQPHTRP